MLYSKVLIKTSIFILLAMVVIPFSAPTSIIAAGPIVGYYDTNAGEGFPNQSSLITAAGGVPVNIIDLSSTELASINVLFITDWFGTLAEYNANFANIDAAVQGGLVLVYFDGTVTGAANRLPGGSGISIVQAFTDIVDIDQTSILDNGPNGILDNTSLDGGGSSTHGYATTSTLPGNATCYLIRDGFPDQCVAFSYPYGAGGVFYSTIPLGAYLRTSGSPPANTNTINILGPNTLTGAIAGLFSGNAMGAGGPANNGEVLIRTSNPVMAYQAPNAGPVRNAAGGELFLPNDADGNGFDTYLLSNIYTYNGELWLQIFIGGNNYIFVLAENVEITRNELSTQPVEWND